MEFMKRIILSLLFAGASGLLFSQTANEIVKFSQQTGYGTSRGMAMGGAVGALYSEYASVNINPAALGTFHTGQVMLTPGLDMHKTNSNGEPDSHNSFVINGANIVYSFDNSNGDFNRFNISFGYNLNNNFNTYYKLQGIPSTDKSLTQDMVNKANAQYSGYDSWASTSPFLKKVGTGSPSTYVIDPASSYTIKSQQQHITTVGHTGEYALSFGTSFRDKLYLGVSAGLSELRYERMTTSDEKATYSGATNAEVFHETATFINGRGFDARLGILYTPVEDFTIGVAVQSPAFYSLSVRTNGDITAGTTVTLLDDDAYDFTLRTPWRLSLSASYAVKTLAVFSFDYDVVTNNLIKLDGNYSDMTPAVTENIKAINNYLASDSTKVAMNIRVGGEVRLSDFFVRAGFGYFGAPADRFKGTIAGSAGVGYRIGYASIDAAYRYAKSSEDYYTYSISPLATTDYVKHQIMLTFSYRF
jgi:hypothetical protein